MSREGTAVTSAITSASSISVARLPVSSFLALSATLSQGAPQRYSTAASRSSVSLLRDASSSSIATADHSSFTSTITSPASTEGGNKDRTATDSAMKFFALFVLVAVFGGIILWLFYRRKRRRLHVARQRVGTGALRTDLHNMSGSESHNSWHHRASEAVRSIEHLPVYLGDPPHYPESARSGLGINATTSVQLDQTRRPMQSQTSVTTDNSILGSIDAMSDSSVDFDELESMSPYRADVASMRSIEAITHVRTLRYDASRSSGSST